MPTKPRPIPNDTTVAGLKQLIANLKRTKKGTQLAKRRRAEAIERYENQWLPDLERREAEAAHEARLRQIAENAQRMLREANQPAQSEAKPEPRQEIAPQPKGKRKVFHFLNTDTYFVRGCEGLVQLEVRRSNGRFYDMADGEELEAIPTGPQPVRGAVLLNDGEWQLPPPIKHPNFDRPKPENSFPIIMVSPNRQAAEKRATEIRTRGYQARLTGHDSIEVLYDFQWIPLGQWKQIMGVEI